MLYRHTLFFKCLTFSSLIATLLLHGDPLDPIYISQVPYTITQPGYYALDSFLSGSSGQVIPQLITIASHDVVLDLNGNTLSQNTQGQQCVAINGGSYNIIIKNGYISGNNGIGINAAGSGTYPIDNVTIENVLIGACNQGISCKNTSNSCIIKCNFTINTQALFLDTSFNNVIDGCNFYDSNVAACLLNNSSNNNIRYCRVLGVTNGTGMYAIGGMGNTIRNCTVEKISNSTTQALSCGIGLTGEFSSNVLNCTIVDVSGQTSYGIFAPEYYLLDSQQRSIAYNAVAWSADGKYVAVCGQGFVVVYTVVNGKLTMPVQLQVGSNLTTAAWAYGAPYLAIGGSDSNNDVLVQVYAFNGTSLQLIAQLTDNTTVGCTYDAETNLVNGLSWSVDSLYLAVAQSDSGYQHGYITIVRFDQTVLTPVCTNNNDTVASSFNSVAWMPTNYNDSYFMGASGYSGSGAQNSQQEIRAIYKFDPTLNTVTKQAYIKNSIKQSAGTSVSVCPLSISNDGNVAGSYVAFGGLTFINNTYGNNIDLYIYNYNPANPGNLVPAGSYTASQPYKYSSVSVAWSSFLPIIATGAVANNQCVINLFQYNTVQKSLIPLVQTPFNFPGAATTAVAWQPGGLCLAQASQAGTTGQTSLYGFNLKCIMQNNVVSAAGVGIEGNSHITTSPYAPNLIAGSRAVQNTTNYGTAVDWVETNWSDVYFLSNLSWQLAQSH